MLELDSAPHHCQVQQWLTFKHVGLWRAEQHLGIQHLDISHQHSGDLIQGSDFTDVFIIFRSVAILQRLVMN
jgi:hypothetical protein